MFLKQIVYLESWNLCARLTFYCSVVYRSFQPKKILLLLSSNKIPHGAINSFHLIFKKTVGESSLWWAPSAERALSSDSRRRAFYLRVTFSKNQRNRGHSSKFNLAHTLSIGRPRSHTYYKDVRLLKFSRVWEKSTWNGLQYFLEQNLQNLS